MIPRGTYGLEQIVMEGPCKAPISIELKGTMRSPVEAYRFKPRKGWINFKRIDDFTLYGGGGFNGEGTHAWGNFCPVHTYCNKLPIVGISISISFHF